MQWKPLLEVTISDFQNVEETFADPSEEARSPPALAPRLHQSEAET
jgi:hypothetical protein